MQEPKTWREFLGKIIEDPREKQQLANLLGINERTLDRWATGLSSPRSTSHVRQLLTAFPHHRTALSNLMRHDFPDAVEQIDDKNDVFIDEMIKDVPIPFYKRILETYTTAVEPVRAWSICNLVLQQLTQHLDFDHQGIKALLMQCLTSAETGKVHSLHKLFEHTTNQGDSENCPFFSGAESLAGLAVMKGVPQVRQILPPTDIHSNNAHDLSRFQLRSAAAYPIQRAGRCAGSLLVLSTHVSFFTQARLALLQHYIHLLTLAFQEQDFFVPTDIALQPMPTESTQQYMLDKFQERVSTIYWQARGYGNTISWNEAELLAMQQIEAALEQLGQKPQTQSISRE